MNEPLTWCGVQYSTDGLYDDGRERVESDIAIIGIPYDAGASAVPGQSDAPYKIRALEAFESWHDPALGDLSTVKVVDLGDVPIDRRAPDAALIAAQLKIGEAANNTKCLVTLGGDHSVSAAVINRTDKMRLRQVHLVHIDAHGDTWPVDPDHFWPGHESWVTWVIRNRLVESITQLGVRALGPPAKSPLPIRYELHTGTFSNMGLRALAEEIRQSEHAVHLSVDMDVVDPAYCPGVAYPEPGGWTPSFLLKTIETLVSTGRVDSVDIVEITPSLDRSDLSVRLAHRCVLAVVKGLKRAKV